MFVLLSFSHAMCLCYVVLLYVNVFVALCCMVGLFCFRDVFLVSCVCCGVSYLLCVVVECVLCVVVLLCLFLFCVGVFVLLL